MFRYKASPYPKGNENVRRECRNSKCKGTYYIRHGAQNYKCPHCGWRG